MTILAPCTTTNIEKMKLILRCYPFLPWRFHKILHYKLYFTPPFTNKEEEADCMGSHQSPLPQEVIRYKVFSQGVDEIKIHPHIGLWK